MCVNPKGEALEDLKATVAALVFNGVLCLARRNGEVGCIVDHACRKGGGSRAHVQPDP